MDQRTGRRMSLMLGALAVALLALGAIASSAGAASLKHGAVFTESNTTPNYLLAFTRTGSGLKPAGKFATGGNGSPTNPPAGFPVLDSSGPVGLDASGTCLFAVNAGSNTVSSFSFTGKGLKLASHPSSGGSRPISLTTTLRSKQELLYVLNSTADSASIQGYTVSPSCGLSRIRHSSRPTSSPKSVPAAIKFDIFGKVLAVSERFSNDIDIFPVNAAGVARAPVVTPSDGPTPYALDWNNRDILAVSNEDFPPPKVANSTVTSYKLAANHKLVKLATAASPGAACWLVFTKNGKFLYVTNPAGPLFGGHNVMVFKVGHSGSLTAIDKQDTTYNSIDDALSANDKFLYVLSDQILPVAGPNSAINAFKVNPDTGTLTPAGSISLTGNHTSGLVAN